MAQGVRDEGSDSDSSECACCTGIASLAVSSDEPRTEVVPTGGPQTEPADTPRLEGDPAPEQAKTRDIPRIEDDPADPTDHAEANDDADADADDVGDDGDDIPRIEDDIGDPWVMLAFNQHTNSDSKVSG